MFSVAIFFCSKNHLVKQNHSKLNFPCFYSRYCEEELQEHIDKLHEYNEIKDVGQLLIGKLG